MPHKQWFDELWRALVRRGLPPDYAHRFTDELRDHAEDLEDAGESTTAIGSADELVAATVMNYRAGRFAGRYPILALLVGPMIATFLLWITYTALADIILEVLAATDLFEIQTITNIVRLFALIIPVAVVRYVWQIHRGCGRPTIWFFVACIVIAVLTGLTVTVYSPNVGEAGVVSMEIYLSLSWWQLVHMAVPLIVATIVLTRSTNDRLSLRSIS